MINRQKLNPYLWIFTGIAAFFVTGITGSKLSDERMSWQRSPAHVVSTKIAWAQHMTDEYALMVKLMVTPESGQAFEASLMQAGPKGALQKRAESKFANGAKLQVRINPEIPGKVILDIQPGWGPWIVASIFGLLLIANGTTLVVNKSPG